MNPMTTIKPEDKNKVIALGTAIALMFGYVGVSFARSRAAASVPPPAPTTMPGSSSVSDAPPPGTATVEESTPRTGEESIAASALATEAEAKEKAARQRIVLPDLNRDPFAPVATGKNLKDGLPRTNSITLPAVTPPPVAAPKPAFALPFPFGRSGSSSVAGVVLPTAGSASPATGMPAMPPMPGMVLPAFVPEVPMSLAGVIRGEVNAKGAEIGAVAMIKAGGGQQFVHLWDTIEGWRVVKIAAEAVTLRRGSQTRVLRVGAGESSVTLPATTPTPLPSSLPTSPGVVAPAIPTPVSTAPGTAGPTSETTVPVDSLLMPTAPRTVTAVEQTGENTTSVVVALRYATMEWMIGPASSFGRRWMKPLAVSEYLDEINPWGDAGSDGVQGTMQSVAAH